MKVIYARVSTKEQNEERQLTTGVKSFVDRCSGSIPFLERPQAKNLMKFLKDNPQATTEVHSIDRLGRNTRDILDTLELFDRKEYIIKIKDLGLESTGAFFKPMITIISALAEHERNMIRERTRQGIEIRKAQGGYKGRTEGSIDSRTKILQKHEDIVNCLKRDMPISEIARTLKKTRATIYKVKAVI